MIFSGECYFLRNIFTQEILLRKKINAPFKIFSFSMTESPLPPPETPESHLKAIREMTKRNEEILEKMLRIEERREFRRKWKFLGSFLMVILPYVLMALASWYFYMQVTTTIERLEDTVKSVIPEIPESWTTQAEEWQQKISEQNWKFWEEESNDPVE